MNAETPPIRSVSRTILALVALAACAWSTGCGSTYSKLAAEHDAEPTATLIAAYDQLTFQTTLHETRRDGEPSARIAIHETGRLDSGSLILFIHGVFTDSNTWRYALAPLAQEHRLWLIDSPGCGDSDAPSPGSLRGDGYGPAAMTDRVLQALTDKLASGPGPLEISLVAHSLGGGMAIQMLADPGLQTRYAPVVDRIERAVLMAPLHVAQNNAHSSITRIATVGGLTIGVGDAVGYVREQCAVSTIRGYGDARFAVREEADKRYEILTDPSLRHAMQAQLLQAVPFDDAFLPRWDEMDRQTSIYPNYDTPSLIIWGAHDEMQPVSTGYLMARELKGASLIVVPGAKHSVQMERAGWVADAVDAFIDGRDVPEPYRED